VFSNDGLKIDSSKNVTGTHDGTEYIYKSSFGTTNGDVVSITYTITDYVSGQFRAYIGNPTGSTNVSGNGTYTFIDTADTEQALYLQSKDNFIGTISSISVKKVDLKGYWRNNGAEAWYDLSPYGNDGTVNGSPTTIQLQEVPYFKKDTFSLPMNKVRQKGLNFDGDSYVKVTHDNSLGDMSDGFTCMFWYRHAEDIDTNNWFHLVSKGTSHDDSSVHHGFGTSSYNNKIFAHINTSQDQFACDFTISGASPKDPKWWHVAVTYNGSNYMRLCINGAEKDNAILTGAITSTANALPIMIGTDFVNDDKLARGVIDEVKWYNRDLELKEIEKDYKATKSRHSSTSAWSDDFSDGFI